MSGTVISSVEQKQYRYEPCLLEACNQVTLIFSDWMLSNIPNSSHMKFFTLLWNKRMQAHSGWPQEIVAPPESFADSGGSPCPPVSKQVSLWTGTLHFCWSFSLSLICFSWWLSSPCGASSSKCLWASPYSLWDSNSIKFFYKNLCWECHPRPGWVVREEVKAQSGI